MNTLTIRLQSYENMIAEVERNSASAAKGEGGDAQPTFSFESWEAMHRTLAPKRTEIVMAMAGRGSLTVREVAKLVNRDIKNVHGDLDMLVKSGVVDKTEDGFAFPYDRIHFEFDMEAAA
ncbi:HVO_A0114 family putative DNA-binding protein [Shinella zoogloeoides]|uniref:HVO_A0114 family putative DNA-binding protein n=1 Tax=Shinella zoogloeoides TaxID=352475 RepID=UPI0027401013|nr:transcriptional regulator [Shinella zoogloeoides]WLR93537.1 transcriptional regulator [Shinella zoogloeoides]